MMRKTSWWLAELGLELEGRRAEAKRQSWRAVNGAVRLGHDVLTHSRRREEHVE
jgi:hypothetical protein